MGNLIIYLNLKNKIIEKCNPVVTTKT